MITLWLASSNPGKLREFAGAARTRGLEVRPLPGYDLLPPCVEDAATFEENARKKAAYYSQHSDGLVFADDSGIAVDALGGRPGVYSARFAGLQASDEQNNTRLLAELRQALGPHAWDDVGEGARESAGGGSRAGSAAHYVCAVALARRGRVLAVCEGRADGTIIGHPRGSGGFGYDPYFFYPPLGRTFAELTPEAKFAVSHRGQAFRNLLDAIERMKLEHVEAGAAGLEAGP